MPQTLHTTVMALFVVFSMEHYNVLLALRLMNCVFMTHCSLQQLVIFTTIGWIFSSLITKQIDEQCIK